MINGATIKVIKIFVKNKNVYLKIINDFSPVAC